MAASHRRALPLGLCAGVVMVAVLLYFFPLFHIVPLVPPAETEATRAASGAAFDAAGFAEKFWAGKLLPAARAAAPVGPMLAALRRDPAAAMKQHAHRVGLGNAAYYFARGTGRVLAVEGTRVVVTVDDAEGAQIVLRSGPLFGNAVRDGTGLLNVNDFPGLQEFNALAAELNRLAEARVLPGLRERAQVGRRVTFAGVAEAPETIAAGPLLTFVPVEVEVLP